MVRFSNFEILQDCETVCGKFGLLQKSLQQLN